MQRLSRSRRLRCLALPAFSRGGFNRFTKRPPSASSSFDEVSERINLPWQGTRKGRMETFTIEGKIRQERGKNAARRTRLTGMVPAVLYGGRKDSISLSVSA